MQPWHSIFSRIPFPIYSSALILIVFWLPYLFIYKALIHESGHPGPNMLILLLPGLASYCVGLGDWFTHSIEHPYSISEHIATFVFTGFFNVGIWSIFLFIILKRRHNRKELLKWKSRQ